MPSPSAELLRDAADRRLAAVEQMVEAAVLRTMRAWLQSVRFLVIREVLQQQGITAAGYPTAADEAVDAATAAYNDWRTGIDNNVLPAVSIAFGDGFQQVRLQDRDRGSFTPQQEHMERVADRLRIWPDGAFEDLRPELVEALAAAESIEEIKDRVGRVLQIDTDSRAIKARINEVETELADPMLDTATRRELRALRRDLWREHDAALSKWEWKARRIARTEAHGAVNAGQIAAARQAEADTGETYHKRWLATEDARTRVTHRVADGQTVRLAEKFRVGGFMLDFPGDPIIIAPHEVINCRCTMLILDPGAVADSLRGPDSSDGAITPGGVRLGADDADDAAEVIRAVAAEEHRALPTDVDARGEDYGQQTPGETAPVDLDDRDDLSIVYSEPEPAQVDLTGYSDDELLQMMLDTADDLDGMYEAARDEYDRRSLFNDAYNEEPVDDPAPDPADVDLTAPDDVVDPLDEVVPVEAVADLIDSVDDSPSEEEVAARVSAWLDDSLDPRLGELAEETELRRVNARIENAAADPNTPDATLAQLFVEADAAETRAVEARAAHDKRMTFLTAVDDLMEAEQITEEEARTRVTGHTQERVRRDLFVEWAHRESLTRARTFREAMRDVHQRMVDEWANAAEDATNGYMTRHGSPVSPKRLWSVNEATARRWMTDEMAEWFDLNGGRITLGDFEEHIMGGGDPQDVRVNKLRGDYLQ